jgi:predicted nucleic acid-binding protein
MNTGGPGAAATSAQAVLSAATRLFLDTAPVIYFVEANPQYVAAVDTVFRRLDTGTLEAVVSPVTLAECLVHPIRNNDQRLIRDFTYLLTSGPTTRFVSIDAAIAQRAAELRVRDKLTLTDAFQLAVAEASACSVFLTNDADLKRADTPALRVVTVNDLLATGATLTP